MFNRILTLPLEENNSIFLFGPRGTGKTSWIRSHLPNQLYLDLLDFSLYSSLVANPHKLENLIPKGYTGWIIIDEVQRIPELLNEVHRLIEHKKLKFLLTGSSARSLRRARVNLLAGRALRYHMHPLVIQEIAQEFTLEHAILYGLLPAAVGHSSPKKYLESYVQTYIKEEVLQEGLTRNIGAFTRFLEAASFSQGQLLNFSEIARELSLNRLLVANYFDILEDLLLSIRISSFSLRAKRKTVAHQKFYFFDAGVYRAIRPRGLLDSPEEAEGVALETLFLQSLLALNDYYNLGYKIHFWRTLAGDEVDFIIYGPKGFHAFEIKRSSSINTKALKGLTYFGEEYPEATLYLIYLGKHKEYHGNIQVLPFEQTLRELLILIS
ncbi:ATP-binding protein [Candidatus Dependentiae bacterium]|nr:ATP-binding protein [Candidatus Dependentiae bacterium]